MVSAPSGHTYNFNKAVVPKLYPYLNYNALVKTTIQLCSPCCYDSQGGLSRTLLWLKQVNTVSLRLYSLLLTSVCDYITVTSCCAEGKQVD